MRRAARVGLVLGLGLAAAACAPQPARPGPDRAAALGVVELVPREELPAQPPQQAYGDRRLRDVRLVDYSTPGFAVVYLDLGTRPGGAAELAVEDGLARPRLRPALAAVGAGGEARIANRSREAVTVSVPSLSRVETLAPGGRLALRLDEPGPVEIFLLGSEEGATVWASPGPWTQPDAAGRFALGDLPPGRHRLRAWHPRFPASTAEVELLPGQVTRGVLLEIGVGRDGGAHDGAH